MFLCHIFSLNFEGGQKPKSPPSYFDPTQLTGVGIGHKYRIELGWVKITDKRVGLVKFSVQLLGLNLVVNEVMHQWPIVRFCHVVIIIIIILFVL